MDKVNVKYTGPHGATTGQLDLHAIDAAEFKRRGSYVVAHYDESLGCDVADHGRSVAYALELAGLDDTPEARDKAYHAMAYHGRCTLHDTTGRAVIIYDHGSI